MPFNNGEKPYRSMDQLSLCQSLQFKDPAVISFYGAGGKTYLLFKMAAELNSSGRKALITTTTKMHRPPETPLFLGLPVEQTLQGLKQHFKKNNIAFWGRKILAENKIEGVKPELIEHLRNQLNVSILVEADGAGGRPIKGYAAYEPVIPSASDCIVAVIGADALGAAISSDNIHRVDQFLETAGFQGREVITEGHIAAVYLNMLKIGQNQSPNAGFY